MMIITTDDLAPAHMEMFRGTWDKLKEKHPKLSFLPSLLFTGSKDQDRK